MSGSWEPPAAALLLEFAEAWVHQVLALRRLYAPEAFERRRLYDLAVKWARHPGLCAYVAEAVESLKARA